VNGAGEKARPRARSIACPGTPTFHLLHAVIAPAHSQRGTDLEKAIGVRGGRGAVYGEQARVGVARVVRGAALDPVVSVQLGLVRVRLQGRQRRGECTTVIQCRRAQLTRQPRWTSIATRACVKRAGRGGT
jgi:hypothetical protein